MDGTKAICQRSVSAKRVGDAGFLHTLTEPIAYRPIERNQPQAPKRDFGWLNENYIRQIKFHQIVSLGHTLHVSCRSLQHLRVGFDGEAFTFPMQDERGKIIGIRRRLPDGMKLSVKGGSEGVFLPEGSMQLGGPVFVTEGASDAATLFDLGCPVIGRPSCSGGTRIIRELVRRRDVVIISDADKPNRFGVKPGEQGADRLADELLCNGRVVKVITPLTGKDVREWNPTRQVLDCVVKNTSFWSERNAS